MAGVGVGEGVALASLAASLAGTTTKVIMDNNAQRSNLRQIEAARKFNEQKRKNLLEERLARKRAMIGSMGISATGSSLASQSKLVSDTYKDIAFDNYNYRSQYAQSNNSYYSKLNNQIIDGVNNNQMVK